MSYTLGQVDPTPPPMRPVSWPTILGWAAVVGVALAVFNGTVNMRSNRRRSTRRVRRNAFGAFTWDKRRTPTQVRTSFLFTEGDYGYYYDASGKIRRMKIAAVPQTEAYKRYLSESRAARGLPDRRRTTRNAGRRSSHARPKPPKMSELGVWAAIGAVREAHPREHLDVLPPGVAAKFKKLAPGLYKYGYGPKKGEVITQFKKATLKGAMTSTRIGAKAVGEYHWVVDNFDPSFPVVVRGIDDHGRSYFRIEEYAKNFERVPVMVRRSQAKSAR